METDTKLAQIKVQLIDPHQITLWGVKQLLSLNGRGIIYTDKNPE